MCYLNYKKKKKILTVLSKLFERYKCFVNVILLLVLQLIKIQIANFIYTGTRYLFFIASDYCDNGGLCFFPLGE